VLGDVNRSIPVLYDYKRVSVTTTWQPVLRRVPNMWLWRITNESTTTEARIGYKKDEPDYYILNHTYNDTHGDFRIGHTQPEVVWARSTAGTITLYYEIWVLATPEEAIAINGARSQ